MHCCTIIAIIAFIMLIFKCVTNPIKNWINGTVKVAPGEWDIEKGCESSTRSSEGNLGLTLII